MRKSRFLLNLIAVTAIGLSAVGCGGSSNSGVADTSDDNGNNGTIADQRRNLREYMIVATRGIQDPSTPLVTSPQVSPTLITPQRAITQPGDGDGDVRAQLYEIQGIADLPNPNAFVGGTPSSPEVSSSSQASAGAVAPGGTTGYHQVYASPSGSFVIAMSRARFRGYVPNPEETDPTVPKITVSDPTVTNSQLQIFTIQPGAAFDEVFPPVYDFGATADPTPIRFFPPNQGEFVSGVWGSSAQQFYASIDGGIIVYSVDGTIGRIRESTEAPFPQTGTGINNAVEMIASPDGKYIYALDNANGQIVTYARDAASGALVVQGLTPTVADPRGMTLDRSGRFIYVAGRASQQIGAYQFGADGLPVAIEVFPGNGVRPGNVPNQVADVESNPQSDQLYAASFNGVLQSYTINPDTGSLTTQTQASVLLVSPGGSGNIANIEVEPTGRFLMVAQQALYETVTGAPFANLNPPPAGGTGVPTSSIPQTDNTGRIAYITSLTNEQLTKGAVQTARIESDGSLRAESTVGAPNPYGLTFFQKVITPPSGVVPGQPIQQ